MPEKIIVVGAGLSGLAAAKKLHPHHEVLVLEARDRIGGRTWTDKLGGLSTDMGASWIHGANRKNPILKLAQEYQLELQESDYDSVSTYRNGQRVKEFSSRQLAAFFSRFHSAAEASNHNLAQVLVDTSSSQEKLPADWRRLLSTVSIEHEFATDLENLSFASIDEGLDMKGPDMLIKSGYQNIANELSQGLDIRLNTVVTKINFQGKTVTVETETERFEAHRVVLSVPLGVLKSQQIQFTPELPQRIARAIDELEMGTLNKIWMKFPKVFWPENSDLLRRLGDDHRNFPEWVNAYSLTGEAVLLGFNAGSHAQKLEKLSDTEMTEQAMRALRDMFGPDVPEPEAVKITRWSSDKFSRGSYSYLPFGVSSKARSAFHRAIDQKVFFAGEHSSVHFPSTTHGAYLSGIRAADSILKIKAKR